MLVDVLLHAGYSRTYPHFDDMLWIDPFYVLLVGVGLALFGWLLIGEGGGFLFWFPFAPGLLVAFVTNTGLPLLLGGGLAAAIGLVVGLTGRLRGRRIAAAAGSVDYDDAAEPSDYGRGYESGYSSGYWAGHDDASRGR
jgi:hypothetical protein